MEESKLLGYVESDRERLQSVGFELQLAEQKEVQNAVVAMAVLKPVPKRLQAVLAREGEREVLPVERDAVVESS